MVSVYAEITENQVHHDAKPISDVPVFFSPGDAHRELVPQLPIALSIFCILKFNSTSVIFT